MAKPQSFLHHLLKEAAPGVFTLNFEQKIQSGSLPYTGKGHCLCPLLLIEISFKFYS